MGIMDWLFRANKGEVAEADTVLQFDHGEEEFHGLNMKSAIEAHQQWKDRLEKTLAGTSGEKLEVSRVAADCYCTLGQWLHGEAKEKFSQTPEYRELMKSHADFHLMAGDILCDAHAGQSSIAHEKLKTVFRKCSDRVQLDLVRLYARCK
jgi:hypothetical protein